MPRQLFFYAVSLLTILILCLGLPPGASTAGEKESPDKPAEKKKKADAAPAGAVDDKAQKDEADEEEDPEDKKEETGDSLPVPLPDVLPGGAVRKFTNAVARKSFLYSGRSEIVVYEYTSTVGASDDLDAFIEAAASGAEKPAVLRITADRSEILASHNGAYQQSRGEIRVFFRIDVLVVEVVMRSENVLLEEAFQTCEKLVEEEKARRIAMFSTVEKAYKTLQKALKQKDKNLLARCLDPSFAAEEPAFMENYLQAALAGDPNNRFRNRRMKTTLEFIGSDEESSTRGWAFIEIGSANRSYVYLPQWLALLRKNRQTYLHLNRNKTVTFWLPFVKDETIWRLDAGHIRKNGLIQRESMEKITMAVGFLRSVALAQEEFKSNDPDGDKKNLYATDYKELLKNKLLSGSLSSRSSWGYKFKFKGSNDGESWSLTATAKNQDKNKLNLFVDQTGVVRYEKGKTASADSEKLTTDVLKKATSPSNVSRRGVSSSTAGGVILRGNVGGVVVRKGVDADAEAEEIKKKIEEMKKALEKKKAQDMKLEKKENAQENKENKKKKKNEDNKKEEKKQNKPDKDGAPDDKEEKE